MTHFFSKFGDKLLGIGHYISQNFSTFHFESHNKISELFVYVLLLVAATSLVNWLLSNSFLGSSYRIFVAPGIVLHEFSHAALCLLTGAKIKSISLFERDGGSVEHEQSKIPIIGPVLISIAPFVAGIAAIYYLSAVLDLKSLPIDFYHFNYHIFFNHLRDSLQNINFSNYKNWVVFYLSLSIVVTMIPSKQDLKNIAVPLIIFVLVIIALIFFKFDFSFLNNLPIDRLLGLLSPILLLLILALIFSIIIYVLSRFAKK